MNNQKLNNLLKDPNTNWRYLLIVVILAFLVGGGILGYCYWWLPEQETGIPEIEIPQGPKGETTEPRESDYSQERQTIGQITDGLVLNEIRHADHGTFYRFVFEIKGYSGLDVETIPYAEASFSRSLNAINILINGIRRNMFGPPPEELVMINDPVVVSYVQDKVYDDQAVAYTIALKIPYGSSGYYIHSLLDPARIILDIKK